MARRRIVFVGIVLMATLAGCGGGSANFDELKTEPIARLNCSQLEFMARKYESIGDSSKRMAESNDVIAVQVMQAYNKAAQYYSEIARRC